MNRKSIRNWTLYVLVVVVVSASGNWLWRQLAEHQNGPLAKVTWTPATKANHVHVLLTDQNGNPLRISLITIITDAGVFDVTTNNWGIAQIQCDGTVVMAIRANRRLVFSKAFAEIIGSPPLAKGLNFKIVAKRPDLLARKLPARKLPPRKLPGKKTSP